jgi:hypothetical protein
MSVGDRFDEDGAVIEWDDGDVAGNREADVPVFIIVVSFDPPCDGASVCDLDAMASLDVDGDSGFGAHVTDA